MNGTYCSRSRGLSPGGGVYTNPRLLGCCDFTEQSTNSDLKVNKVLNSTAYTVSCFLRIPNWVVISTDRED